MKKIIRIASVITLACASLVYVGCTKDFSADIAKTNSDVSALKSKVDALDATVQTINSTVANLQTTKADVTYVDAADKVLGGKIDDLTAELAKVKGTAEQAVADAAKANEAAAKVAEDLKNAKAELDTIIAGVNEKIETLEVNTDSLRKDVDSLYKNSADFENRIAALEGKVEDIAARVNSIVAVPSYSPQVVKYSVDTIGAAAAITDTIFTASFAVTPKTAASSFSEKNATLIFKNGLERMALTSANKTINDTVIVPSMVSVNKELGVVTVYAPVNVAAFQPLTRGAVSEVVQPYYSLVFEAEDNAGEYAIASSFSKVNVNLNEMGKPYTLHEIIVLQAKDEFAKVGVDTISYAEKADTVFSTAFGKNKRFEVVALVNESTALSLKDFAAIVGTKPEKLAIDTVYTIKDSVLCNDSTSRCSYKDGEVNVTSTGWWEDKFRDGGDCRAEYLFWQDRYSVGSARPGKDLRGNGIQVDTTTGKAWKVKATDNKFYGNKTVILYSVKAAGRESDARKCADVLYIGAKDLGTYDLGKTSEEWYYDYAKNGITATYTITNEKAAKAIKDTLVSGKFSVSAKNAPSVNVDVNKVAYAKVAADTTYNVTWATHNDLSAKGDSTIYSIAWAYKVGPRPANPALIKFAADTTVAGIKNITFKFDVKKASVAAVAELNNRSEISKPVITAITVNEKEVKKADFSKVATVDLNGATLMKAKPGVYVIDAKAECCGIVFTYEFTLTVTKGATVTFKALSTFVEGKDGNYTVKVGAPEFNSYSRIHGRTISDKINYRNALNQLKFYQLFEVDTTVSGPQVVWAGFEQIDTTASKAPFNGVDGTATLSANKVNFNDDVTFNWAAYDSTAVNVASYLILEGAEADTVDAINIKFWIDEPIKSVSHIDSTIKHNNGKADVIDLGGLFTMTDYVDSTIWANGGAVWKGTYFYGQKIEFEQDPDEWTITGGTFAPGTLTIDGSKLSLSAESADIVNPITVEIPFVVKHDLDQFGTAAADRQGTVKVTYTK